MRTEGTFRQLIVNLVIMREKNVALICFEPSRFVVYSFFRVQFLFKFDYYIAITDKRLQYLWSVHSVADVVIFVFGGFEILNYINFEDLKNMADQSILGVLNRV
ncbi:hypothetical protein BDC45DRAFT_536597 [Circinella umbellata]|nr:hypothetical protein BDC45DRAFT_536597 [Circinella umbellata]